MTLKHIWNGASYRLLRLQGHKMMSNFEQSIERKHNT